MLNRDRDIQAKNTFSSIATWGIPGRYIIHKRKIIKNLVVYASFLLTLLIVYASFTLLIVNID